MKIYFTVGPVTWEIETPLPCPLHDEDRAFLGSGGQLLQRTGFYFVDELPPVPGRLVCKSGAQVYQDEDGTETRLYTTYLELSPAAYCESVYKNGELRIYFRRSSTFIRHEKFRIWNVLHMEALLLKEKCLILHCCYMHYRGRAILFSAPAETGKTTQGMLWRKVYGSDIINGDKCLLQKKEGVWHACGFPFHGSAPECKNLNYPVGAVVILRQAEDDLVREAAIPEAVKCIYSECTFNNWKEDSVNQVLDLACDLAASVPVVFQYCTLKDDAAFTLHKFLYGE